MQCKYTLCGVDKITSGVTINYAPSKNLPLVPYPKLGQSLYSDHCQVENQKDGESIPMHRVSRTNSPLGR